MRRPGLQRSDQLQQKATSGVNPGVNRRQGCGAGQGVGLTHDALTVAEVVGRLKEEYASARARLLERRAA
jgi:NAD(P)H-dependent flavin oxidoreductase YrpB (nitropropane dioxygenase family)